MAVVDVEKSVKALPVEERLAIQKKYDFVWNFSEGLAVVKQNGKWGVIDKCGKVVVDLVFDGISISGLDIIVATVNGKDGTGTKYYYELDGNFFRRVIYY